MPVDKHIFATVGFLVLAVSPASAEDFTIVFEDTAPSAGTWNLYISPPNIAQTQYTSDHIVLYDVLGRRTADIHHRQRQYTEFTAQDQAMLQRRLEEQDALGQRSLPAEQPEANQMRRTAKYPISIRRDGERRNIAGYNCEHYIITSEDETFGAIHTREWWVAPDLQIPSYFEMLKSWGGPVVARISDEMKDKGFPLAQTEKLRSGRSLRYGGSLAASSHVLATQAIEVTKGKIEASVFQVPTGYAKVCSNEYFTADAFIIWAAPSFVLIHCMQ